MSAEPLFVPFPKIARLKRSVVITEKIDGTNACVHIDEDGSIIRAGSRSRWIRVGDDNFGFAAWVEEHIDELLTLGPGTHFGEWWGRGIQRGYGLQERRFSLFNTSRWSDELGMRPACCHVVPVLSVATFTSSSVDAAVTDLRATGSRAAPGFMQPEGVVVYVPAGNILFKVTLEKDDEPKSKVKT